MGCSVSDLRFKEVINICDAKRLGCVVDVSVDVNTGQVVSIIIPGESKFFGFKRAPDIVISWDKVVKIGEEIILVNIPVGHPHGQNREKG